MAKVLTILRYIRNIHTSDEGRAGFGRQKRNRWCCIDENEIIIFVQTGFVRVVRSRCISRAGRVVWKHGRGSSTALTSGIPRDYGRRWHGPLSSRSPIKESWNRANTQLFESEPIYRVEPKLALYIKKATGKYKISSRCLQGNFLNEDIIFSFQRKILFERNWTERGGRCLIRKTAGMTPVDSLQFLSLPILI